MAIETTFPDLDPAPSRQASKGRSFFRTDNAYMFITYAVLIVAVATALIPFLYVISTSLKDTPSLFSYPPQWIPENPTITNYRNLVQEHPFNRWLFNSFFVATTVTLIKVVIDSMAGYAFAKMRFAGRDGLFALVLLTLMVPFSATLIPLYIIVRELHMTNSYWGLILPPLASPIGIFMMRQFIETLPTDLENAARLDGCSEFQIYRKVILPLMKPALVVLGVFTFMNQWTSYLWPLVVNTRTEYMTITVGIQSLRSLFTVDWGILSAGAVLSMLPLVLVFIFLQRYFIAGSIAGALKE